MAPSGERMAKPRRSTVTVTLETDDDEAEAAWVLESALDSALEACIISICNLFFIYVKIV